jgi:hypothetical protein
MHRAPCQCTHTSLKPVIGDTATLPACCGTRYHLLLSLVTRSKTTALHPHSVHYAPHPFQCLQFVLGPRQRVPEGHPWHWSMAVHNKAIVIARAGVPGVEWIRNMMELSVRPVWVAWSPISAV